jgi:uncharacterized membrane protein
LAGVLLGICIIAAVIASPMVRPRCTQISGSTTLTIPLAKLARGAVHFFCYRDNAGDQVRFVLARGADGRMQSVFDACRQCYKFHRGYTSSGAELICRLCGNRYKIKDMHVGKASCVPVSLPVAQNGDAVRVKITDLKNGRSLF